MSFLRWLFVDRASGRVVVAQWPNPALWIFLASLVAGAVVGRGEAGTIVGAVGTASLVVWAADEILRGANPWRRLLGAGVLLGLCLRGGLMLTRRG